MKKIIFYFALLSISLNLVNSNSIVLINASTLGTGDTVTLESSEILQLSFKTNPTTGFNEYLINAE